MNESLFMFTENFSSKWNWKFTLARQNKGKHTRAARFHRRQCRMSWVKFISRSSSSAKATRRKISRFDWNAQRAEVFICSSPLPCSLIPRLICFVMSPHSHLTQFWRFWDITPGCDFTFTKSPQIPISIRVDVDDADKSRSKSIFFSFHAFSKTFETLGGNSING